VVAHDVSDHFNDTFDAELRFPCRHALGDVGRTFADDFKDVGGVAAVFPFRVRKGEPGEFVAREGAAEVRTMTGGAVLLEGGFAGFDGGRFEGELPQFRVVEGFEFLEPRGVNACHGFMDTFFVRLHGTELIIGEPVEDKEGNGDVEREQPPVGEFLVILLDAVVNVFAKNRSGIFLGLWHGALN
jgi:hypothetical protein